jgi:hypothetical protein
MTHKLLICVAYTRDLSPGMLILGMGLRAPTKGKTDRAEQSKGAI